VWERPTRVLMTGLTLVGAGVVAGPGLDVAVVTAGAAVGALLGAVGVVQLGIWLRRALAEPGSDDGTPPA
jgi:archaetidylinositol phosphate synthase